MRYVFRLLCVFAVIGFSNSLYVSHRKPVLKNIDINKKWHQWPHQESPRVVFIGNSILKSALDYMEMSEAIGTSVGVFAKGGTATAAWYLVFKNFVLRLPERPEVGVFLFRDYYLTDPTFHTRGKYKKEIYSFADENEPVLERLAYLADLDPVRRFIVQRLPLFRERDRIKEIIEDAVKHNSMKWTIKAGKKSTEECKWELTFATRKIFGERNMDRDLLTLRQFKEDERKKEDGLLNFAGQIDRSFLPHIIKLAGENDVDLIFARMRRRRDAENKKESEALRRYIEDLRVYLEANGAFLVDLSGEEKITRECFAAGDHIHMKGGRKLVTQLIADKLNPLLQELQIQRDLQDHSFRP